MSWRYSTVDPLSSRGWAMALPTGQNTSRPIGCKINGCWDGMQTRLKGSPLCLSLTFLLTVNIVWILNNMQHPGAFRIAFWKLSVYFQSWTVMFMAFTTVEILDFIWGKKEGKNEFAQIVKNKQKKKQTKTASCCKSSWVSKCWTYHYVWTVFAQVSFVWWGPFVILNGS